MNHVQTNWDKIFENILLIDNNTLDLIEIELLIKYYIVIEMQFYIFDELFDKSLTLDSVCYFSSNETFIGNENDLLDIASTTKRLYPKRMKIKSIIKDKINKTEFLQLYDNSFAEYAKFYNIK